MQQFVDDVELVNEEFIFTNERIIMRDKSQNHNNELTLLHCGCTFLLVFHLKVLNSLIQTK